MGGVDERLIADKRSGARDRVAKSEQLTLTGVKVLDRGTFVLETAGEFDGRVARWEASVVAGSSTGELPELSGGGTFEAPLGSEASYELELELLEG